ncbi:hypothetical protein GCM10027030_01500 [Luteococcus sediminum]
MEHLAVEQPGDGLQADVRVRANVDACTLGDVGGPHVVGEAPVPDRAKSRRGRARRIATLASWVECASLISISTRIAQVRASSAAGMGPGGLD